MSWKTQPAERRQSLCFHTKEAVGSGSRGHKLWGSFPQDREAAHRVVKSPQPSSQGSGGQSLNLLLPTGLRARRSEGWVASLWRPLVLFEGPPNKMTPAFQLRADPIMNSQELGRGRRGWRPLLADEGTQAVLWGQWLEAAQISLTLEPTI